MILSPNDIPTTLSFILLLIAPGALLCYSLLPMADLVWSARIALWIGMSVAAVSLGYEWLTALNLALRPPIPALILAACCLGLVWLAWRDRHSWRIRSAEMLHPGGIALAVIVALTIGIRFYQARDLALPAWVDSLHHALIIRVALETGQAPLSLRPYLPVDQLPFHWGYHAFSAFALQAASSDPLAALPNAMLIQGQIVNGLTALAFAGLAQLLFRRPLAGAVAALVVGLLSIMPAYYLSWGRYTLLMGALVLPAVLIGIQLALRQRTWRAVGGAAILLAGLSIIHFVVFVFACWWAVVLWLDPGRRANPALDTPVRERLGQRQALVGVVVLGLLLALPWMTLIVSRAQAGSGASGTHIAGNSSYNAMPIELLWASNNRILLALAGCGALLGVLRRARTVALLAIWFFLVILLANPPLLGLPYLSFVTNETVAAMLFIPCALLIAAGVAAGIAWAQPYLPRWWPRLVAGMLVAIGVFGVWSARDILRADTILATQSDRAAIEWAATNTPPDARFLVNTVGWLSDVDRGSDGGWWLLPLAGRAVSTPPVVYTYASDPQVAEVKRLTAHLRALGRLDAAQVVALMQAEGYQYVYATEGGLQFDAATLRNSPSLVIVYHNDHVTLLRQP